MALTKPSPKVIFFDLDSTLIHYTEAAEVSWREACCQYRTDLEPIPLDQVLKALLEYVDWFWSDPVRHKTGRADLREARRGIAVHVFETLGIHTPGLAEKVADVASARREAAIALFADTVETLTSLRKAGIRLGMITNGDSEGQRYKINTFGLEPYFEAIQIEGEAGIGKPEDGVYEMALKKFEVTPTEAWMVGDDLIWDIQAAQKAGLKAAWLDVDRKGVPPNFQIQPDRTIHALKELLRSVASDQRSVNRIDKCRF